MNKFERLQPKTLKEKVQNTLEKIHPVYCCTCAKVSEPETSQKASKKSQSRKI